MKMIKCKSTPLLNGSIHIYDFKDWGLLKEKKFQQNTSIDHQDLRNIMLILMKWKKKIYR
jgi:hypothetical protein